MIENCKGCKSKDNCEKYIDVMKEVDISKCVCRKCLIKGMCRDPCDDFINLFKKYYEKNRRGYLAYVWWIKKYEYKDIKKRKV